MKNYFIKKKELYVGVCVYIEGNAKYLQGSPGAGIIYDCDVYDMCDGKQTQALWKAANALNYWGISPTSKLFSVCDKIM